ncbi:MAG TPA: polysaccharide biosynthesis protein [Candidatus Acidoferrum sp.]|jgi:FlaA1/EpsC-like NDP-sugar epimerase
MDRSFEQEFQALFPERKSAFTNHFNDASVRGRRVLVTGAGGSIGSALATTILGCSPKRLILLDHSIHSLQELQIATQSGHRFAAVQLVLADLRDNRFVIDLLKNEQPEIVFHAAAFKHVPLLEENPFTAIENNALATWRLAQNAAKYGVHQTFLISTDKAANPRSMLGISKRLAELAILRWNHTGSRMTALRMGNVAGSSGSVLPKFREQIQQGGPVTVTHPRATRYFLTMKETCCAISALANLGDRSGVFVPEMGDPISILDLATRMVSAAKVERPANVAVKIIGLRPGDKLHEDLLSHDESLGPRVAPGIRSISSQPLSAEWIDQKMRKIEKITELRDSVLLLDELWELAPGYQPVATRAKSREVTAAGSCDD